MLNKLKHHNIIIIVLKLSLENVDHDVHPLYSLYTTRQT